jgi:hypothetical protein
MRTSDSINELASALSAAQAEMKPAPMTGRNSILNNRYSTLSDVIETARPILAKHGLSYVQFPKSPDDLTWNFVGLVTRLMHTGGQWLEEEVYFPMGDGNRGVTSVQVAGSTITYMRRYAVAAMLGIVADEDTDGNGQKQEPRKTGGQKQAPPPAVSNTAQPRAVQSEPLPSYDATRTYADGSPVDANAKAVETYDAYVAAHDGNAPDNVHNLRNWYKGQKNGHGKAAQPALAIETTDAAKAASDTAAGLMGG